MFVAFLYSLSICDSLSRERSKTIKLLFACPGFHWRGGGGLGLLSICSYGKYNFNGLLACWVIFDVVFWLFFSKLNFQKMIAETLSDCQTIWIQIRSDTLFCHLLITLQTVWTEIRTDRMSVQTVCKVTGRRQKSPLARKEFTHRGKCIAYNSLVTCLYYIWAATQDFHQCGMCNQQSLRSACT